jgi:hypothetical protein
MNKMKSRVITTVFGCIITLNLTAQVTSPIIIGKEGHRSTYQQNGRNLTQKELAVVLKSNTFSVKEYKKCAARSNTGVVFVLAGMISSGAGVVCSGLSLISRLDDNNDKASDYLTYSGITLLSGLGLITIGAVIGGSSVSHLKKSINNYNGSLKNGRIENTKIYFVLNKNGVGVQLRF